MTSIIMRSSSYVSCFCMYLLVSFVVAVVVPSSFGLETTVVLVEGFSCPSPSHSYGANKLLRRSTTTTKRLVAAPTHDDDHGESSRTTNGLVSQAHHSSSISNRRSFMLTKLVPVVLVGVAAVSTANNCVPPAAAADTTTDSTTPAKKKVRYVLDEETGDYIEVEEETWQEAWRGRWNEASTMSTDQIFEAARGAGNLDKKSLEDESPASKRRRALSACRNPTVRSRVNNDSNDSPLSERDCTARILKEGEIDFILNVLGP